MTIPIIVLQVLRYCDTQNARPARQMEKVKRKWSNVVCVRENVVPAG